MNADTGAWICFRCDARGRAPVRMSPNALMSRLRGDSNSEWSEVQLPDFIPLSRTARKYLRDRGIDRPEDFGMVEVEGAPRILIPYRGPAGRVIYWTTRSFMDDGMPKYVTATGRKPLYVLPRWTPQHRAVLFVEGVFDAIAYFLASQEPAIAIGGKFIPSYSRRDVDYLAPEGRRVMLDSDATSHAVKIAREFDMKLEMLPKGMDPADYYQRRKAHDK